MIGVSAFIEKVRQIAARDLTYRTGGVGKDGTCDCIGLIMGAMYELGRKRYDLHSTNYFARYQTEGLKKADEKELAPGKLLYRARADDGRLNARYKAGGRYDTGDPLDYYHVGVVTSVRPLEIIECTEYGNQSGIMIRTTFKNWQFMGDLKGVLYDGYEPEERKETLVSYKAIVTTQKDPLRIREWPITGDTIGKAPRGATVEVIAETGDGWPKIRYNGVEGYASREYLTPLENPPAGGDISSKPEPGVQIPAEEVAGVTIRTIITDSAGRTFEPEGAFTIETVIEVDGEPEQDGESVD